MFEILKGMSFLLTEVEVVTPEASPVTVEYASSAWPTSVVTALCVVLALVCVVLTVIILLQKKRASGIGAAISGSGETYWSKNKGKSIDGTLEKYTKWGGFCFLAVALLINMLM